MRAILILRRKSGPLQGDPWRPTLFTSHRAHGPDRCLRRVQGDALAIAAKLIAVGVDWLRSATHGVALRGDTPGIGFAQPRMAWLYVETRLGLASLSHAWRGSTRRRVGDGPWLLPYRGAMYPPGTPLGDSTSCHSCACRQRKLAIDAAR